MSLCVHQQTLAFTAHFEMDLHGPAPLDTPHRARGADRPPRRPQDLGERGGAGGERRGGHRVGVVRRGSEMSARDRPRRCSTPSTTRGPRPRSSGSPRTSTASCRPSCPPSPTPTTGTTASAATSTRSTRSSTTCASTPRSSIEVAPDAVAARGLITGSGRESGIPIEMPAPLLMRLRDGKVVEMAAYPTVEEAVAAGSAPASRAQEANASIESKGFTAEERARDEGAAPDELKAETRTGEDGERALLAKVAEMPKSDRDHGRAAPRDRQGQRAGLSSPKTWYGMRRVRQRGRQGRLLLSKARTSSSRGTRRSASTTRRTWTRAPCGRPPSR